MGKEPLVGKSEVDGATMHFTVGAIIKNPEGKYLLINRKSAPLGFACIAGHMDVGEKYAAYAMTREIREESGFSVNKMQFLENLEMTDNPCKAGIVRHFWYLYECECSGIPQLEKESAHSIGWYSQKEVQRLANAGELEPVWQFWLLRRGIINSVSKMRALVGGLFVAKNSIPLDKLKEVCGMDRRVGEQCDFLCLTIHGWACEKGTEMGEAISAKAVENNKKLKVHCKE